MGSAAAKAQFPYSVRCNATPEPECGSADEESAEQRRAEDDVDDVDLETAEQKPGDDGDGKRAPAYAERSR